ncbi:hypothetical protein Mapa_003781 [Marchantia paleacea]|nr:hypothetical protein Mapa_003781 [Marchantia paleacea]
MVPLLVHPLGTARVASAAQLGHDLFSRRHGVPGLNSRFCPLPSNVCATFLPSSRFLPARCLSVSAGSNSPSEVGYETSIFLHSLEGRTPTGLDSNRLHEEDPQCSKSDDGAGLVEKSLSSEKDAEKHAHDPLFSEKDSQPTGGSRGALAAFEDSNSQCSVSDSRPPVRDPRQEERVQEDSQGRESSSSAVDWASQFHGRNKFLNGDNDYQSWMPSEAEGRCKPEIGAEILHPSIPHSPSSTRDHEDKNEIQQAVVLELGDRSDFSTSSSVGESKAEAEDEPIQDLLLDFLGERSKNWGDGKTRITRVEHQSVFGNSTTSRITPVKQKFAPNLLREEDSGSEDMANSYRSALLNFEMPSNAQGKSAPYDDVTESGGLVEVVLKLARNLPQNCILEEFMKSFLGKVSTIDGNLVLRALAAEQMTWPLISFFQWMRLHDPCLLDSRSFCIVFTYLGKVAMVDEALTLYRNLPADSKFHAVQVYNALIATLARCDRGDKITTVLEDMKERKVERDTVTYSVLITATQKETDRLQRVWSVFDDMLANGVNPDLAVFGNIIKAFCHGGYHKQASLISISMEKMGLMPNVIIYNTLIDAYGKAGQLEEAEGLLLEMTRRGLHPTAATYNSLINGYGKKGQCEVAEELMLDMQREGLEPDVYTFTSLIRAYGKQQVTEKAVNVFLRMRKIGIAPTTHSYTALINAYSEGGWHDRAQKTFADMLQEGLKPTIETYTALLDGYRRAGRVDMVLKVWKAMREEGCELTEVTYNTLMDAFAKQGRFNEVRDVFAAMRANGMEPDLMAYNMLLNAYGRGGLQSKLPKIVMEMRVAGHEPDSFTYCTLIYASLRLRDFTSAFKWEREMSENGQRPDSTTYAKMKHLLNAKYTERQENDRKAALGQLRAIRKKARKNPQRLKTFKQEITALREGPLAGYRRPRKAGPSRKQSEKDKALWKRDDDQRHP